MYRVVTVSLIYVESAFIQYCFERKRWNPHLFGPGGLLRGFSLTQIGLALYRGWTLNVGHVFKLVPQIQCSLQMFSETSLISPSVRFLCTIELENLPPKLCFPKVGEKLEIIAVTISLSLPTTQRRDDPFYLLVILFQVYYGCARNSCQIFDVVLFDREVFQA